MFKIMRHYCQHPRFPWAILYSILVCYERHWQLYRTMFDGRGGWLDCVLMMGESIVTPSLLYTHTKNFKKFYFSPRYVVMFSTRSVYKNKKGANYL